MSKQDTDDMEKTMKKIDVWHDELRSPEDCKLIAYGYNQAVEALNAVILEEVRADRKANAEFWKSNIDKMFDKEIAIYKQSISKEEQL